jgi:hypothetical protein
MGRGVHFAITQEQRDALLAKTTDEDRVEFLRNDIEGAWEEEWLKETDKAWDAIHLVLTEHPPLGPDDDYDENAGTYPLKLCIAGGHKLLKDEDQYIFRLIEPAEVVDLARALEPITEEWFSDRYWRHCKGYSAGYGEEDIEYTWCYFDALRHYFVRVAPTGRAVVFHVSL